MALFCTHNKTSLPSCSDFMQRSVQGDPKAPNKSFTSNLVGKPPIMAPFGATARTSGMGARSSSNFFTMSRSAGFVMLISAVTTRSATLPMASSNTFFIAADGSGPFAEKKAKKYLLSALAFSSAWSPTPGSAEAAAVGRSDVAAVDTTWVLGGSGTAVAVDED